MSRVVLLDEVGGALYLEGVKFNAEGDPISGEVVNGGWHWSRADNEETATDNDGYVRNRWQRCDYAVVAVGNNWRGDYNAIIDRARETLRDAEFGTD